MVASSQPDRASMVNEWKIIVLNAGIKGYSHVQYNYQPGFEWGTQAHTDRKCDWHSAWLVAQWDDDIAWV